MTVDRTWTPQIIIDVLKRCEVLSELDVKAFAYSLNKAGDDEIIVGPIPFELLRMMACSTMLQALANTAWTIDEGELYQCMADILDDMVTTQLFVLYKLWHAVEGKAGFEIRRGGILVRCETGGEDDEEDSDEPDTDDTTPRVLN